MGWDSEPRDSKGNIVNDPSDDELLPNVPGDLALAQDSSPVADPTWNASPNPNAPSKRPAPPFPDVAPDGRAARVDPASAPKDDQVFAICYAMTTPTYLITVSRAQVQLAGKEPNHSRPAYSALYPEGNPTEVIHDPAFNQKNFWGNGANDGWVT